MEQERILEVGRRVISRSGSGRIGLKGVVQGKQTSLRNKRIRVCNDSHDEEKDESGESEEKGKIPSRNIYTIAGANKFQKQTENVMQVLFADLET